MQSTQTPIDLTAIENKARQMRAEAVRHSFLTLAAWIARVTHISAALPTKA